MTDFYIAFDNEDEVLGDYFVKCMEDLKAFLETSGLAVKVVFINSRLSTSAYLETVLTDRQERFFFIVYSHGNRVSLKGRHGQFIEVNLNTGLFVNSFFYCTACLCAHSLGSEIIEDGGLTFIGYSAEVYSLKEEYEEISMKCDNSGLQAYLSEDITAQQALDKMKNYYTFQINKIYDTKDPLRAGLLTLARESLILKGNGNLRFSEMNYDVAPVA